MKAIAAGGVLVTALAFALTSGADGTSRDRADWSHCAPIRIETVPEEGVVEFALTPEVFDLAREDLADLRVSSETGDEAPYVVRVAGGQSHTVQLSARLYNRTYISSRQSSVTVDFGRKILKNRIKIVTPGTNFRRKVTVEGSDDGQSWQRVREDAFLFRIAAGAAGGSYDKNVVSLPDNDQRYLRVTVRNGPDAPGRLHIQDVSAWREILEPPGTALVPVLSVQVRQLEKERATEIILDLGYRKLPLHKLKLQVTDANFFRRVNMAGRNRKERTVRTPVEDGPPREKTVEEPWEHITGGVIYRYSSADGVEESLTLGLKGARERYLRLRIKNEDDPPLQFQGVSASRLVHYLAFQPKWAGDYTLYLGDPSAPRPSYDIVRYVDGLRREGVSRVALGETRPNPAHRPREEAVPWSERYKWLIWIALLGALATLGALVYRQIKTAPAGPK